MNPNEVTPNEQQEPQTIQDTLIHALTMMRDGRATGGRNWAVAITELEKVYAYWVHFVQTQQEGK